MFHSQSAALICTLMFACLGTVNCAKSPDAKATKYLEIGKQYMAKGDYPRAVLAFRNASEAKPSSAEPVYQLGLAMSAMGDASAAAILFHTATELDKKHIEAHLKLADLMATSRDTAALKSATDVLQHVLDASPGNADALSTLSLINLRLGNTAAAETELKSALKENPAHTGLVVNLARTRLLQKDLAGSEQALLDGIAADGKSIDLVIALAEFYSVTGSIPKAEKQYRRALELDRHNGTALLALGKLYDQAGRHEEAKQAFKQLASTSGSRYRSAYASYLFEKGKIDEGLVELEHAVRAEPENRQSTIALVNAYLAANRTQKASELLTQILSKHSDDVDALLLRARLSLSTGDLVKAADDLNRAIRLRPQSAEAHYLRAHVRNAAGDKLTAQQDLSEAVRLDQSFLAARIAMAAMLVESGAVQSALMLIDEAPASQKTAAPLMLERNWALLAGQRHAEAAPQIEAILKVARVPEAVLQKATLQVDNKAFIAAKATLEEALILLPDDARVLYLVARAYEGLDQSDAGLNRIKSHIEQRPEAPHLKALFGRMLMERGQYADARQTMEAAVAAAPQLTATQLDLADLDILENKLPDAKQRLHKLLPGDRDGSLRARMASIQHRQGDISGAIESYQQALATNANNVAVLNNLAYLLAESPGKHDEALKYAEKAKELAPENPSVDDTLGWAYFRKGLYSRAVRHLDAAFKHQKSALRAYHLAMAHLKNGSISQGQGLLEVATKLNADLPEAAEARQLLAEAQKSSR